MLAWEMVVLVALPVSSFSVFMFDKFKEFLPRLTGLNNALFYISTCHSFISCAVSVGFFFFFSLFPGLNGFTGSGCLWLWYSL